MPKYQPIKWDQGADWQFAVVWRDENDQLVNLTGYTARMHVRQRHDSELLIELTDANARIIMGGVSGFVQLKLTASETASVIGSNWDAPHVYDLEVVSGAGKVTKLMRGTLANIPEVTR